MPRTPIIMTLLEDAVASWREHREAARTRRIIAGLPHHIRKDIGWPDPHPERRVTRRPWS